MATNLPQGCEQPPDNLDCSYTDSSSIPVSDNTCRNTPSAQTSDPDYTDAFSVPASNPSYRNALSIPTSDPDYRDASSLPISESDADKKDTSCHPVSADDPECDGDASSCYMDAVSTKIVTQQHPEEPPYIDAVSTGSTRSDTREWQQSAYTDASVRDVSQSTELHPSDNQHIYFELEKQTEMEEADQSGTPDDQLKRQTIVKANVNVAARARMFEGQNVSDHTEAKGCQASSQDAIYEVPPTSQRMAKNDQAPDKKRRDCRPALTADEDVYENTFDSDHDQSNQASDLQSSYEGSSVYEVVGKPQSVRAQAVTSAVYRLAAPIQTKSGPTTSSPSPPATDLSSSGTFISCKQGFVSQMRVQSVPPSQMEIELEYNRLRFSRNVEAKPTPEEAGYHTLNKVSNPTKDPSTSEPLYECPASLRSQRPWDSGDWSDGSWGSSEFDEDEDEEGYLAEPDTPAPTKPLPKKPHDKDSSQSIPALLDKLKPSNSKPVVYEDTDTVCLPVTINPSKHPPPELPPPPPGLTDIQKKCRCVVALTISSERSYINSLERIVQEYEKPILDVVNSPKSHIRAVFRETREILNHHKMFQIQLSDTARKWDEQEKIGDIFTASFSKSMLVDAYSSYVNNFAAGMDEIRIVQQSRPNFVEFLKMKEKSSADRLSIFGLMVKPVQRFPQFIMLLQAWAVKGLSRSILQRNFSNHCQLQRTRLTGDLIKYTTPSHHDRRALQLALTELENVTHKLNERKRLSEQYYQAKQMIQRLPRQLASQVLSGRNMGKPRRLIRFDNFDQIEGEMENMKSSSRRLLLMDDMLVCVKVGLKDQDGFMMERYRLKWAARLGDIEVMDTAMTLDMRNVLKMDPARLNVLTAQLEKTVDDPFHLYAELHDMLHDLTVFGKISSLMKTLRRTYQGYNMSEELFNEVMADLQRMIQIKDEQLRLVNSCSIILVNISKADKPHYIMQTPTAAVKNEWCVDFNIAKLAIEKQNRPGWYRAPLAGSEELEPVPAFFMKCVPVDVPRHFTKVKCATPVFIPSVPQVGSLGMQHLWVCTSTPSLGQVSIVSLHSTRPALTESFKVCDSNILCVELVPGCGQETKAGRFLFSEDTVWMSNTHNEMVIFPLSSSGGSTATRDPLALVRVPGRVTSIKFVDERLFCGLDDGAVLVYSRNDLGEWCIRTNRTLQLGRSPVTCQLVVEDNLWVACGHCVHVVEIDSLKTLAVHTLSSSHETAILQMVRSGVGVWVAFHHSASVRLFHVETMDHLQEMSVANTVNKVLAEKSGSAETCDCLVTCLAASTGLLWIGTNVGLILTLPLPRLNDGVPLYRGRPSVAYHAHRGPVRFIIPVYCSGCIMELYKNSTLRTSLHTRPSLRNRKRELIEMEGLAEDKLLSSGAELEMSQSWHASAGKEADMESTEYVDVVPPKPSEVPERMKDPLMKSQAGRKFLSLKRFRHSRSSSLKVHRKVASPMRHNASRMLSFRSELANQIKRNSMGQFQARSMLDLRLDDSLEVEMLYKNLLGAGDLSEEDDDSIAETLDDLSVQSDTLMMFASEDSSNSYSMQMAEGKGVEPLDLSQLSVGSAKAPILPSNSSGSAASEESVEDGAKGGAKVDAVASAPPRSKELSDMPTPPPSPRIAAIRARTMWKTSTNNAVMVLSGGDGYWDMHSGGNFSKNEDAALLFWIYKF